MIKIILYCDHWQNGGVEAYLMNQLRHWDLSQIKCIILTAEKTTDRYDQELQRMNVRQHVLLQGECSSPILRILRTFRSFRHFLAEHACDILYLNLTNSVTMRYAQIAKYIGISRRIVHSHAAGIQPGKTRTMKLMAHKWAKMRYADAATDWWACSDRAASFMFLTQNLSQVVYIPNAIATDRFKFCEKQRTQLRQQIFGDEAAVKIVGTIGRCSAEKNQVFLLDVFAAVYRHRTDVRLLLVGDGPMRVFLEERAKEQGIIDVCVFYGFTNDVAPFYSAMDVFCLPSVAEGFGIVALEAQAAGCICLLSDVVPQKVNVLSQTRRLPLEASLWEKEMLSALHEQAIGKDRLQASSEIKNAGFDIAENAAAVQKMLTDVRI